MLPTVEETEIWEKSTAEAKKHVAKVLNQQRKEQSIRTLKATAHSDEAPAKLGKYASINRTLCSITNSHELNYNNFPGIMFLLKPHVFNAA